MSRLKKKRRNIFRSILPLLYNEKDILSSSVGSQLFNTEFS